MAVIWGLDLRDMKWGKFKSSYMFKNRDYHLRRTKFVVYQLAMIFCVISESFGTKALDDYIHQQRVIEGAARKQGTNASIYNNDFVGVASFNIFNGVYVATIFGAAFFFDLFWPERYESPAVKIAWRVCSVLASLCCLASAIALTIIFATRSAHFEGEDFSGRENAAVGGKYKDSPFSYKKNKYAITSLAFLWPGFLSTVAATIIMWMSLAHNDKLGPKSTHARSAEKGEAMPTPSSPHINSAVPAQQDGSASATNGTHTNPERTR